MTPEFAGIDPELETLLREVATDPRSQLLRASRPANLLGVFERASVVTVATAGLTHAERHLIDARRAEVAHLLREACVARFLLDPKLDPWVGRYVSVEQPLEALSESEWRTGAERELSKPTSDPATSDSMDLLARCVEDRGFRNVSITQLALASMRLEPTDSARVYIGIDQTTRGQPAFAQRALKEALRGPRNEISSYAHEAMALSSSELGQFQRATDSARAASSTARVRPQSVAYWVYYSLMAEDHRQSIEASDRLKSLVPHDHPAVLGFASKLAQRESGVKATKPRTQKFVLSVMDNLSFAAREVANALL